MKKLLFLSLLLSGITTVHTQTLEELKSEQAVKKDSIAAIQGRVDAIQGQIDGLPGWKKGAFGTIGGSISSFTNWYSQGTPNNNSGNIGFTVNAFANLMQDDFFWRNALSTNLSWVKLDDKDNPDDDDSFNPTTDVFNISSLYGRKLSEKWAASALGEYRTTLLNNFNDPGYLDFGVGFTWTPITNLFVVIHPANYNFVFSDGETDFDSSFGAKIMADYTRQIGAVNFKSNLSMFQSYKSSDLSNWTWTNSFGYTLWKMIGVGFDFGLRQNKQEAHSYEQSQPGSTRKSLASADNKLQSYWMFGLNYKL